MDKAGPCLHIITRTDAATVKHHLQQREYLLRQAVLDADDADALDAAFCALFDFMEPDLRLATGSPRGGSEGGGHGDV